MDDLLYMLLSLCIIGTFIKYLKMKNIIKIIFILIILSSCSPRARFNRLIKNHPELTTQDTVKIPELLIQKEIKLQTDTIRFDSLLYEYVHTIDTVYKLKIKKELYKGAYKDTTFVKDDSLYNAKISWKNGILLTDIKIKAKSIPCTCPVYTIWSFKEFWILIGIFFLFLIGIIYKLFK